MDDAHIEAVARAMCIAMGLDPEERIGAGWYDDLTGAEFALIKPNFVPAAIVYMKRWQTYRRRAADAIVAHKAVSDVLTAPPKETT